jgi:hypothetical protein
MTEKTYNQAADHKFKAQNERIFIIKSSAFHIQYFA